MQRTLSAAALLAALVMAGLPAAAQMKATAKVIRAAGVLEAPRGDSVRLATVSPGQELEVLDQRGNWLLVTAPGPAGTSGWRRGWIHSSFVEASGLPTPGESTRSPGEVLIRGFGQTGGMLFDARESFDALLDSSFGLFHGGGAQVVLGSGIFVQVSAERFRSDGARVLLAGDSLFALDVPARITVRPVLLSVGYRSSDSPRFAPYVGAGAGWHSVREESSSLSGNETVSKNHPGYHVLGGIEIPLGRWMWLAGEVQWTGIPGALGDLGISSIFNEEDLGGTTFRFKVIVGR